MPRLVHMSGHEERVLKLLKRRKMVTADDIIQELWPAKAPAYPANAVSHIMARLKRKGYDIEHVLGYVRK